MAIAEVSRADFTDAVLKSEGKVLVDFNADWCGPCRMLRPMLEEVAEEHGDMKFLSVNIDNEEELAEEYGVSSIPCLVMFNKGAEVRRSVGLIPKNAIEKLIGGE